VFPIVDNSPDEVITFVDCCFREEVTALIDAGARSRRTSNLNRCAQLVKNCRHKLGPRTTPLNV